MGGLIAGVTPHPDPARLSYTTSADFSRYLPRTTSPKAIAGWTALGGFLPGVLVCSLGALAATAVDMTDPQDRSAAAPARRFGPVFLLALVLGTIAINALTAYSAGLALQAVGIRIRRSLSVLRRRTRLRRPHPVRAPRLRLPRHRQQRPPAHRRPPRPRHGRLRHGHRAAPQPLRRPGLMDETPGSAFWYTAGVNLRRARPGLAGGVTGRAERQHPLHRAHRTRPGRLDLALPAGIVVASRCSTRSWRAAENPGAGGQTSGTVPRMSDEDRLLRGKRRRALRRVGGGPVHTRGGGSRRRPADGTGGHRPGTLEFGVGTGRIALALAGRAESRYHGIDMSGP
ncbi:cytosine permease [Streptomyces thinghirensis]|nr:cytosine permease [Streptomyces thinghirensis]